MLNYVWKVFEESLDQLFRCSLRRSRFELLRRRRRRTCCPFQVPRFQEQRGLSWRSQEVFFPSCCVCVCVCSQIVDQDDRVWRRLVSNCGLDVSYEATEQYCSSFTLASCGVGTCASVLLTRSRSAPKKPCTVPTYVCPCASVFCVCLFASEAVLTPIFSLTCLFYQFRCTTSMSVPQ